MNRVLSLDSDVFKSLPDKIEKGARVFAHPFMPRSFVVFWELALELRMIGGKAFMQL